MLALKAPRKYLSPNVGGADGQQTKGQKTWKGPYLAISIAPRNRAFLALNLDLFQYKS